MGAHHTKDKGDLGVAKAYADLVAQGYMVLFPTTEHAPFDLVTYANGQFSRIQVKHRAVYRGAVTVELNSTWSDRHGVHKKAIDKADLDVLCIYCPDTDECYYVSVHEFRKSVTLRIDPSRNSQSVGVLPARNFRRFRPDGDDQLSLLDAAEISPRMPESPA
jgi:hypothetical protein